MNILDENFPENQRQLLIKRRIHARHFGQEIGIAGTSDEDLIVFLRSIKATFFTHDQDFFRPDWIHPNYYLVWLNVRVEHLAKYLTAFLRHDRFNSWTKRRGCVIRVQPGGIEVWKSKPSLPETVNWIRRA